MVTNKYSKLLMSLLLGTSVMATNVNLPENNPVNEPVIAGVKRKLNLKKTPKEILEKLIILGDKSKIKLKAAPIVLPSKVDHTPYAMIFNQGDIGSCTANSAAQCTLVRECYQLQVANPEKSTEEIKAMVKPFSRMFHYRKELIYDKYNNFDKDDATDLQDDGSSIGTSLLVTRKIGVPDEIHWAYDTQKINVKPSAEAFAHCNDNKNSSEVSEMLNPGDIVGIKTALAHGVPVQIGAMIYSQFQSDDAADTGFITVPKIFRDYEIGGHATAILGYDDKLTHGKYKGYFIVANSWGTGWGATINGQRGFYYLPYEYVKNPNLVFEIGQYSEFVFNHSK